MMEIRPKLFLEECFLMFGVIAFAYMVVKLGLKCLVICLRLIRRRYGTVDLQKYGQWAIVTGCTSGIGKSYAVQLAEKGLDLVLISRNPQKLSTMASDIEFRHKVHVKTIVVDFKRTDIYDYIREQLTGLEIGILVNNVGMQHTAVPQRFHKLKDYLQYCMDSVHVNILSCVMMTGVVLPVMLQRRKGLIINLGSFSGSITLPYYGVYPATKAFLEAFSRILQLEYASSGLTVQHLMPCYVQTNMTETISKVHNVQPGLFFPTPDSYVATALSTVGKEAVTAAYWPHELQEFFYSRFPPWLLEKGIMGCLQNWERTQQKLTQDVANLALFCDR